MKITANLPISHPAASHGAVVTGVEQEPLESVCLANEEPPARLHPSTFRNAAAQEAGPIRDINRPGETVDVESHLVPDKKNIICFWATWCPWSQKAQPKLQKLCTERPEFVCLRVDIDNFESPVARQHGITSVPAYMIYDEKGELVASGKEAFTLVNELFEDV